MEYSNLNNLRRTILESLYTLYREFGRTKFDKSVFEPQLIQHSTPPYEDLLASLNYLADKGYIEFEQLDAQVDLGLYEIKLRADGIDLIEDESEFNQKFKPSTKTIQIALGDHNSFAGRDNNITTIHDIIQESGINKSDKDFLIDLVHEIGKSNSPEQKKSLLTKFTDALISSSPGLLVQIISRFM